MSGALRQFTARRTDAGAAFSPTDIGGLTFWFDADQITGLADTDPVAQWDDQSGNNRHALQADPADQPLYRTAIRNSLPVVQFVDAGFMRTGTGTTVGQPGTVFVVAKLNNATAQQFFIDGGSTSSSRNALFRNNGNSTNIFAGTVVGDSNTDLLWHYHTAKLDGASSFLRTDGTQTAAGNAGTQTINSLTLAAQFSDASPATCYMAEVIYYDAGLSTADVEAVETYLSDKWGF